MGEIWDKVKIFHTNDLKNWTRIPQYRDHDGLTLGEYRAQRKSIDAVLWKLQALVRAQDRLAELDVNTPVEYVQHFISVPRSIRSGQYEIVLPEPDYPASTITCDAGEVSGQILRIPRSWRRRKVTARYTCKTRVINADEIAKLKDTLSTADEDACSQLAKAQASRYRQPVLFISHRRDGTHHPDPEGHQLAKLQALEDCFLIYDYASFPQDPTTHEDETALLAILSSMNDLISNVVLLGALDYLERGWCIYEYIVASMRASIVCDEINDPNFVMLRNLSATRPPVSNRLLGHSIESEIQNAKNQRTLETVNTILPLFNRSKFTVERDREIVRNLLVSELMHILPGKMEYLQYLGEWKTISWTEDELRAAFASELKWEHLQFNHLFRPFELKVPSTLEEAVINGYRLDRMPAQNDWTWLTLTDTKPLGEFGAAFVKAALQIAVGGVVLLVMLLALLIWWVFF